LISRDSRPFGRGLERKLRSLDWLTPSVVCGSLRSLLGKKQGGDFSPDQIAKLKSVLFRGPFLALDSGDNKKELYFHRPLDFVAGKTKGYTIRPPKDGQNKIKGGSNMPAGLVPAFIQNPPKDDFKPEPAPRFWSAEAMNRWLGAGSPDNFSLSGLEGLSGPIKDERVHVGIDPMTGTSLDSLLFSTTGLDFRVRVKEGEREKYGRILQLSIAIEATPPSDAECGDYFENLSSPHPLGGERRLAEWSRETSNVHGWASPPMPKDVSFLRMVLATPAFFSKGWLPDWINPNNMEGKIPRTDIGVQLVSAVMERWTPISGWSYEKNARGIKPLHRMVPAGSVYFFKVTDGRIDDSVWQKLWLRSVCDSQYINDGFGAALWGVW
jgi:CRISPR-associated protein Cmr3